MDLHQFFHQFYQVNRQLSKKINEQLFPFGLFSSQWTIIYYLNHYGSSTQAEICHYLNVEAPTMTRTVARLEKNGWVVRKPGKDKREKLIQLTDIARDEFDVWRKQISLFEDNVLKNVTDDERYQMFTTLEKMMDNMNNIGDDDRE